MHHTLHPPVSSTCPEETHSRDLLLQQPLPLSLVLNIASEAMYCKEKRHGSRVNSWTRSLSSAKSSFVGGTKFLGCLFDSVRWRIDWTGLERAARPMTVVVDRAIYRVDISMKVGGNPL